MSNENEDEHYIDRNLRHAEIFRSGQCPDCLKPLHPQPDGSHYCKECLRSMRLITLIYGEIVRRNSPHKQNRIVWDLPE